MLFDTLSCTILINAYQNQLKDTGSPRSCALPFRFILHTKLKHRNFNCHRQPLPFEVRGVGWVLAYWFWLVVCPFLLLISLAFFRFSDFRLSGMHFLDSFALGFKYSSMFLMLKRFIWWRNGEGFLAVLLIFSNLSGCYFFAYQR